MSHTHTEPAGLFEHINLTVSDPDKSAQFLCDIFGWTKRWSGPSLGNGYTVHVGTQNAYVALYRPGGTPVGNHHIRYENRGSLNHLGIVVADLKAAEDRVKAAGFKPDMHQTYDPGSRFYFYDHDGVEYEVISYA